jgi:hypothetical protein
MIRAGAVYSLQAFCRELEWGEHARRQALLAGLPVVTFGRQKFVVGSLALRWFVALGQRQGVKT